MSSSYISALSKKITDLTATLSKVISDMHINTEKLKAELTAEKMKCKKLEEMLKLEIEKTRKHGPDCTCIVGCDHITTDG